MKRQIFSHQVIFSKRTQFFKIDDSQKSVKVILSPYLLLKMLHSCRELKAGAVMSCQSILSQSFSFQADHHHFLQQLFLHDKA